MRPFHYIVLASTMILSACDTPIPIAETYPASSQQKVQAAHHWEVLADEAAAHLTATVPAGSRLFVMFGQSPTPFNEVFGNLLVTKLQARGFGMAMSPSAAMLVTYDVQLVKHRGNRELPGGILQSLSADLNPFDQPVKETPLEVLVNVSVKSGDMIVARHSKIYYVQPMDWGHYRNPPPHTVQPVIEPVKW